MVENRKNIFRSKGKISYKDRCRNLGQKGIVLWFTGLSGSGKSAIAIELEKKLIGMNKKVYRLDGDNIRHGLNSDLGFSEEDRNENIRRIAEVAALFKDAGIITLVSFISPYKKMREFAREKIGKECFYEIYIKTDLETCIEQVKQNTRRYAKRQLTWFQAEKDVHWVSIDPSNDYISGAAEYILNRFIKFDC